jgi:hypothetical protein
VQLPPTANTGQAPNADSGVPWYRLLWREVAEGPQ